MKTIFLTIAILLAVSQTAFSRPNTAVGRYNPRDCVDALVADLQNHVDALGTWFQIFVLEITVYREFLDTGREACEKFSFYPPLVDSCLENMDELEARESQRIRCELERKVGEQPELLYGYLVSFLRCLVPIPWAKGSSDILASPCSEFSILP